MIDASALDSASREAIVTEAATTYASYLKVDELLALQEPRSAAPEHDELLFIVVHQVYELWFKELLHELDRARQWLEDDESHRAQHTLKRILSILKVMVAQLDILETMTPLEFLSFRERLEAASGFQSDQFRQIEFVLGVKSLAAIDRFAEGTRARLALERRYREPTLWDAFLRYLSREGYVVPPTHLERDVSSATEPSPEMQQVLVAVYRDDAKNAELCERLVDLDEGIQEWGHTLAAVSHRLTARTISQTVPIATMARPVMTFWTYHVSSVVHNVRGERMP